VKLTEEAPDLDSIMNELKTKWAFQLHPTMKPVPNQLPIGPGGTVDMRFYPSLRLAASEIRKKLSEGKFNNRLFYFMLAAVSGSGKTSVAFDVATDIFTIYFLCIPANENPRTSFVDPSTFPVLNVEVADRVRQYTTKEGKTQEAKRIATVLLVCHLLALHYFLSEYPEGTPYQFLMYQLSELGGWKFVLQAFEKLKYLTEQAAHHFALTLSSVIKGKQGRTLLLVIDEMEGAAAVLSDCFVSRNLSRDGYAKEGRGLLSPLLQAAGDTSAFAQWNLLVMGTGSVLARAISVTSDIGKGPLTSFSASQFPMASEQEVRIILRTVLNISDELINKVTEVSQYLFDARFRLLARTVEEFVQLPDKQSPEDCLRDSVRRSVRRHSDSLLFQLNKRENDPNQDTSKKFLEMLHDAYVSARLTGNVMLRERVARAVVVDDNQGEDWCKLGLAQVDNDGNFRMMEAFTFETVADFFNARENLQETLAFRSSLNDLQKLVEHFNMSVTGKGDMFEDIVFHTLIFSKGTAVAKLPFVKLSHSTKNEAKARWGRVIMNAHTVVRVSGQTDDASFLMKSAAGTIVSPSKVHRADGIALFLTGESLEIGTKLYSSAVSSKESLSQFRSTDPAAAYQTADGLGWNQQATSLRSAWVAHSLDSKVAFRLHVTLPRSQAPVDFRERALLEPGTTVLDNESLVVNIDASNAHELFSLIKDVEVHNALFRLLHHITQAKEFMVKKKRN